ncbi:hypothetical protein DL96DRAFT_1824627 [Flagelloscypha sp. PMI_526]|nr:hypothetical protein DL96DRAFT_1824627 [Flagelloscypha sp. PMI_526]
MSRQTWIGKFLWTSDHLKLEPNSGGVWIPPLPLSYLQKPLSTWVRAAQVEPVRIPGYWQTSSPNLKTPPSARPKPDEQVVYHLHGGGFAYYSGHPSDTTANIPRSLLQLRTLNIARSFSVEYRLASIKPFDVVHPFPTALLDCLSGYHSFVHDVAEREENVIVVGDSAASLQIQLLTTISTNVLQDGPKKPHEYGIADFNETMSPASLLLGIRSEVVGSYRVCPKMCLAAGRAELLFDKIKTLKEDTEKDMGKELLLTENKDASHDWLLWDWHEPERSETMAAIEQCLVTL